MDGVGKGYYYGKCNYYVLSKYDVVSTLILRRTTSYDVVSSLKRGRVSTGKDLLGESSFKITLRFLVFY